VILLKYKMLVRMRRLTIGTANLTPVLDGAN
jgi:hypothetical protein